MIKKIVLGIALFGLVGILVGGAILHTLDKTSQTSEARGSQGHGRETQDAGANEDVQQTGGQRNGRNQAQASESGEATEKSEASGYLAHTARGRHGH